MLIDKLKINGFAGLAPMAGGADRAFREICKDFGADYMIGEMASAKGICMSDRKTKELLTVSGYERPMAIQLFGDEPETMAQAAVHSLSFCPDVIDINMGCPAPKVTSNGGGSALMKNPQLCGEIVRRVTNSVNVPVTVKIRKGWDEENINAVRVAAICEENGAKAVAVHGRTRVQMYSPPVCLDIIKEVKKALTVPVIGNGDIQSPQSAAQMLEYTGCDFLLVGRAALGNPWIFSQINAYIENGTFLPIPPMTKRLSVMKRQIEKSVEYKGEYIAMKEARKHAAWYLKGCAHAAALRREASLLSKLCDVDDFIYKILTWQE